jgi:prepilin-type N-terminal cleavage/methylation domain-containing protein
MKTPNCHSRCRPDGFSLIELLVVIAIIATLAGLILAVFGGVKKHKTLKVAQTELAQIVTAIKDYKETKGYYPPDNPNNPAINPLYFELSGTLVSGGGFVYQTLDRASTISSTGIQTLFNNNIQSFMNSAATAASTDDAAGAKSFLKPGLRPNQIGRLNVEGQDINAVLVCSVAWMNNNSATWPIASPPAVDEPPALNPWRYNSSNPTNNPGSFDLWVDIYISGKTYRVSNWSLEPQQL